jgi:phosphoribosylamine--glycine ligase
MVNKKSLCVVVCSKDIQMTFKKNIEIENLKSINLKKNDYLFHAGTITKKMKKFMLLVEEF